LLFLLLFVEQLHKADTDLALEDLMVVQVPITSTLLDLVEVEAVALVEMVMGLVEVTVHLVPWKKQSLVFQEMTIPYLLKYLKHPSCVMAKLMVATMLIQKLSAKLSTSVPMMEMVV